MMKKALFIGRFQPFHLGHLSVIEKALKETDHLIIGIGSAENSFEKENPFTAGERFEMIEAALLDHGIPASKFCIIPVRNINDYDAWPNHVDSLVPHYEAVYTGSPIVKELFEKQGKHKIIDVEKKFDICSTKIREKIFRGEDFSDIVPEKVAELLKKWDARKRMQINPAIFRAYDIRGIADKDLTENSIFEIGRGVGTYMLKNYGGNLVVGRDNRTHGEKLQNAFIKGLLSTGCNVVNVGLATSPMIYWAVCKHGFDGGMNITASHNPKEYNGIKVVARNAHSVCGEELSKILEIINAGEFLEGTGKLYEQEIFEEYKEELLSKVKIKKPLKVIIDAGNGTTGAFAPKLFRAAGCKVYELYCDLDGTFPNHEANPESEKNMRDLGKLVVEKGADLGIGFDGDGDRIGVVDEKGNHYSADYLIILLARDLLQRWPGQSIIFDTKTSKVVENEIKSLGGDPIRYKTGHSFIETKMKEIDALLAGECSGHMFIGENYYGFDDAFLAALKILEIISRDNLAFSEHFKSLPKLLTTPEIKLPCPDDKKFQVVEKLVSEFEREHKTLTVDGAFVEFSECDWGAVRCSNTTPCLTLRFEAESEEKMAQMKGIFAEKLNKHPEVDMSSF